MPSFVEASMPFLFEENQKQFWITKTDDFEKSLLKYMIDNHYKQFFLLAERAQRILITLSLDLKVLSFNKEAESFFECSSNKILGQYLGDFLRDYGTISDILEKIKYFLDNSCYDKLEVFLTSLRKILIFQVSSFKPFESAQTEILLMGRNCTQDRINQDLEKNILLHFKKIFSNMLVGSWWKGPDHALLWTSRRLVQDIGACTETDLIGKNDFDLFIREHATKYRKIDEEVVEKKTPILKNIEPQYLKKRETFVYSSKIPVLKAGDFVLGTCGFYCDLQEKMDLKIYLATASHLLVTFYKSLLINKNLILSNQGRLIYLTPRESDCIHFISYGKSAKETARLLNLKPRSVESYLNRIKIKTGIKTKDMSLIYHENNFCRKETTNMGLG